MTMYRPVRTVAPAAEPVVLATLKLHCRVTGSTEDTELQAYLDAAIAKLDGHAGELGRCLISQTWRQDYDYWTPALRLPFPDVSSVTSIAYLDTDAASQTVSSSLYDLTEDDQSSRIVFREAFTGPTLTTDRPAAVKVTFVAGYGATAATVPAPIRQAILMLGAHYYANREAGLVGVSGSEMPLAVEALIAPYRRPRWR